MAELVSVSLLSDLESADINKLVYVMENKFIYKWNGSEWKKQILQSPNDISKLI